MFEGLGVTWARRPTVRLSVRPHRGQRGALRRVSAPARLVQQDHHTVVPRVLHEPTPCPRRRCRRLDLRFGVHGLGVKV
jgi:succinate dehydrogenase/fumarate reductase flavoprotein subunit